jgi:superfamily I DNA/RNA helicase
MEQMNAAPRQLFITKNFVLRNEVERSFQNMQHAYSNTNHRAEVGTDGEGDESVVFPIFMTSAEWLDALDLQLPGERFFTEAEANARLRSRSRDGDDVVQRGIEELYSADKESNPDNKDKHEIIRREMDFAEFRRLWPKINSKEKTKLNESLVWLEIISFIKGSIQSLKIGQESDGACLYLSQDEYLNLPRKQSRLDQPNRIIVYALFERYERLKRQNNFFDTMDLVHSVARRISAFENSTEYQEKKSFIPADAIFVDEVQDFTQAEIYVLAKLCTSPNNLMLAGDTAQTIAVGVGFRFADCRQVLYETFAGNKPILEKLCENYRSHSGVLRLAASVVELLYFFFKDALDRLPPDVSIRIYGVALWKCTRIPRINIVGDADRISFLLLST